MGQHTQHTTAKDGTVEGKTAHHDILGLTGQHIESGVVVNGPERGHPLLDSVGRIVKYRQRLWFATGGQQALVKVDD
jgi:hypothetical protein